MNRASPAEMRKALVIVGQLKKAGLLFVPIPILNQEDAEELIDNLQRRMDLILKEAEKNEKIF